MSGALLAGVRQRLIALTCLIGMSCGASGILPALVGFVGQLDSDHQVLLSLSGEDFEIRFHHIDEVQGDQTAGDEATLQMNVPDSHDDHVIQFTSPGPALAQFVSTASSEHTSVCVAAIEAEQWNPIVWSWLTVPHARPPPGEATLIRCLHSVVLLV